MSPSKAALIEGIQRLHTEAAGVIELAIVRPIDAPDLLGSALAGDADALRLFRAISQAQEGIVSAPKRRPMLCASCPRPLRGSGYSFIVALPRCDDPTRAMCMAVCIRCGTEPDAITAKAMGALRRIWPDGRPIEVTHPTGARA